MRLGDIGHRVSDYHGLLNRTPSTPTTFRPFYWLLTSAVPNQQAQRGKVLCLDGA